MSIITRIGRLASTARLWIWLVVASRVQRDHRS